MSYFKEFLKDKSVGAISSSSKAMGNIMYGSLNLKEAEAVAEFGAGDGVFTTEILKLIGPNTKFLVFETNELFIKILNEKINDDRVIIIKDIKWVKGVIVQDQFKFLAVQQVDQQEGTFNLLEFYLE